MYAAIVTATVPGNGNDEELKMLREQVVPGIKAAKGFVAGYWMTPEATQGLGIVIFDDEASAKAAAPPAATLMATRPTKTATTRPPSPIQGTSSPARWAAV